METKAQRILAGLLRREGIKIEENIELPGGEADIYLPEYQVVVELDGFFHLSTESLKRDQAKERYWLQHGYHVLRFRNDEIYQQGKMCLTKICSYIRMMDKLKDEQPYAPLRDHCALKEMRRSLLNQERKDRPRKKGVNPSMNPEAYFLSLDTKIEEDNKKDNDR